MIDKNTLTKILEAGIRAPSGDNAQPWRFKIKDNLVYLYNEPKADKSHYNYKQRGSLIALGAVIENISVASGVFAYNVNVQLFPDKKDPNLIAELKFTPSSKKQEDLYEAIFKRATNRKKYHSVPLSLQHKNALIKLAKQYPHFQLILVEDKEQKKRVSQAISFNDRFFLEDVYAHSTLFGVIRWSNQEAERIKTGFHYKTLELSSMEEKAMKLFRKKKVLRLLKKLWVPKMLPKSTSKLYNTSSAIGVIVMQGKKDEDLIMAGRFIERLWLLATQLGVALAPVTAIPYLASKIEEDDNHAIADDLMKGILQADKTIKKICGIKKETICMVVRLGYADEPTAYSHRLPLEKVIIH